LRLCTLAILFIASPAAVAQTAAPAPIPTDAEIRHMLATRVETQRQATGIVVGIVDSTGRRIISYGTMGTDDRRPVGGDTVFDVGSITKVFTALLLSDLVHRGEVALDDPVTKWLDGKGPRRLGLGDREVTLLDLDTSGLPLRPTNLVSTDPDDKYAGYTTELLYQFLSSFEFDRSPGSRYEYSNVGYGLLGEALSLRSGASYRDLLRSRVTQPLGMPDTGIDLTEAMEGRRATGHDYELKAAPRWDFGALESAGGLRSHRRRSAWRGTSIVRAAARSRGRTAASAASEPSSATTRRTASAWSRSRMRRRRSASMTWDCTCSIEACRSIFVRRSSGRKSPSIRQSSTAMSVDTSFRRRTS